MRNIRKYIMVLVTLTEELILDYNRHTGGTIETAWLQYYHLYHHLVAEQVLVSTFQPLAVGSVTRRMKGHSDGKHRCITLQLEN